jgi:hypothetical protein
MLIKAGPALALLLASACPGHSAEQIRCHVKDRVAVENDGSLKRLAEKQPLSKIDDGTIIDLSNGLVRGGGTDRPRYWTFILTFDDIWVLAPFAVQHPQSLLDRDYVPNEDDIIAAATETIRIRRLNGSSFSLLHISPLDFVGSGICEPIQ